MAVALRLMRFGKKAYPTYRIVALDKRSKRDGYYIEKVGLYNPMAADNQLTVNEDRFSYWVGQGAIVSEGIRKLFKAKLPKSTKKVSKPKVKKVAKKKEEPAKEVAAPKAPATEAASDTTPTAVPEPTPATPDTATVVEIPAEEAKTE